MKTIEEKIDKAAQEYAERESGLDYIGESAVENAFKAGADFALSHQWVSVEDALPSNADSVLVMCGPCGIYGVAWYDECPNGNKKWYSYEAELNTDYIQYWMPIPPLPETGKEEEK